MRSVRILTVGGAVVSLAVALVAAPTVSLGASPGPVTPTVVDVGIPLVSGSSGPSAPSAPSAPSGPSAVSGAKGGLRLAAATVKAGVRFDVVGVTYTGAPPPGLDIEARVRQQGTWSAWLDLETSDEGPDANSAEGRRATRGSAPLTAAGSDAVELRVSSTTGRAPAGLSAQLIDGGSSSADANLGRPASSANAAVTVPTIVTRAQWGADERLRPCNPNPLPGYRAAVVHHTVNANNYRADQVPALLRSILSYHTQSLGWCDVGYQFLVDRFGRAFEGRVGSRTGFVQGAQAGGFNTDTFAVSVMGDYTTIPFSSAAQLAVTRVVSWMAGRAGFDPAGTLTMTAQGGSTRYAAGQVVTKPRVMGHQDLGLTGCPGTTAYAVNLPGIRRDAAAGYASLRPSSLTFSISPSTFRRGTMVTMKATVTPLQAGVVLFQWLRPSGYWSTFAQAGTYSGVATVRAAPGSNATYRAYFVPYDAARDRGSFSSNATVRVFAP